MKLLVGVGARAFDESSLDVIAKLANGDEVTLLHVTKASAGAPREDTLRETRASLEARGARVVARESARGDAAETLVRAGRDGAFEAIVVRAHDRHPGLLSSVFGDTVTRLVERADRPVLALRSYAGPPEAKSILLASGRPSASVMDVTARMAQAASSSVTVLHVDPSDKGEDLLTPMLAPPGDAEDAPRGDAGGGVAQVVAGLRARGAAAQAKRREGIVEEQLALEANSGRHWLLVVRGRSAGRLSRVLLGHSFTEDIVRHVRTSILVVK